MKAIGDVAQYALPTHQAVTGLADGTKIVGLTSKAVGDVTQNAGVTIGRGKES